MPTIEPLLDTQVAALEQALEQAIAAMRVAWAGVLDLGRIAGLERPALTEWLSEAITDAKEALAESRKLNEPAAPQ